MKTRFLDPSRRRLIEANADAFGGLTAGRHAAGIEYPDIAEGATDFVLYWRTLPWDHAPGSLLVAESGGRAARPGSPYRPEAPGGEDGLLVAADPATWERCREILFAP